LRALAALPGVQEAVEAARQATTALRWHEALRRRTPQARAESMVRAARASAALDGAELPLDIVRNLVAAQQDPDFSVHDLPPVERAVARALRVCAVAAELAPVLTTAPAQALARLHLAAADSTPGTADQIGRPRAAGKAPSDLVGLGAAPSGPDLVDRLDSLGRLMTQATDGPALVLAAVVHGELLTLRPFPSDNGLVARAMFRALVVGRGLDPTGVAVPEVGFQSGGTAAYVGGAAAYAGGTPDGVALWIRQCAQAVVIGAREGGLVADAVLAGRLTPS
jgi:Fic family protein